MNPIAVSGPSTNPFKFAELIIVLINCSYVNSDIDLVNCMGITKSIPIFSIKAFFSSTEVIKGIVIDGSKSFLG